MFILFLSHLFFFFPPFLFLFSTTVQLPDWDTHTHTLALLTRAVKLTSWWRHHTLVESLLDALQGYTPVCSGSNSKWATAHFPTERYQWGRFGILSSIRSFACMDTKTHTLHIYWHLNHQTCQVAQRLIKLVFFFLFLFMWLVAG